ncbi:Odorant receptor co-receptor [Cephus cinctus]|uniref:Odorant receptor n=1 Tax=Cephus cinctus TaxID=211228 RepID=S5U415_CEPCN|nr:odorant receptor coreceptor [Cephus cinctus]XP_015592926.1 odorant receptor coreceptor isoform X1 [Cephus cinctus]AGS43074.1 odorant receptor Orco [Cephus cinctus]RLZ02183.1 Odorant receptor co-receptor [Cephus cinctus]
MMKFKQQGLVADLMPNIRHMQFSGHFMFNYYNDTGGSTKLFHTIYCSIHLFLILLQFGLCCVNLTLERADVDDLTANTITVLFFAHSIIKLAYFAVRSKLFYRTLGIWNNPNSHPLFAESNARYHAIALTKMRRLLAAVGAATILTVCAWTGITFVGDSVKKVTDPVTNETMTVEIPRLMLRSWYPYDASHGMAHVLTLIYQFYFLLITTMDANSLDVLFCSWLLFACEQLQHLKQIMKPLMELSATLDTVVPHTNELFKAGSTDHLRDTQGTQPMAPPPNENMLDMDLRGIYSNRQDFTATFRTAAGMNFNGGVGPNGLTKKQEMLVRSAIKYWVERHKHIVRLVTAIGDAYGVALLFHMLITTVSLTLLAYQATKVNTVDVYAATVIGYVLYTLGQVFLFCIFGNRLIEESSSVMEAAYSCHWYDGSEEAKTFVQIVCQQCQKAMSISGAKFFTVSLDLFASVLGAVVTYFMVLVQLK